MHQPHHQRRVGHRHAVDVNDMDAGAGDRRIGDILLHRLQRAPRLDEAAVADVGEDAAMRLARDAGDVEHLAPRDPGRILRPAADPDRALPQAFFEQRRQPRISRIGNRLRDFRRAEHRVRVLERGKPRRAPAFLEEIADRGMPDAGAVIDQRLSLPRSVPAIDRIGAEFQLQSRRDPVLCLIARGLEIAGVRVEIDEPRRGDQPARVDRPLALQLRGGDGGDPIAVDRDVADRVEPARRIDRARAEIDHIVDLRPDRRRQQRERRGRGEQSAHRQKVRRSERVKLRGSPTTLP